MPEIDEEKTFTQAEVDEIVKDRLARERAKYADYDALAEKAEAYDAREAELAKAAERASEAEAKLSAYEKEKERAALVKKVMGEHRVDAKYASLLTAPDEEGLAEQAKLVAERFAETVPSDTGRQAGAGASEQAKFAHDLFSGRK